MHIYAVERPDGLVKIGITENPQSRIAALASQGGYKPARAWVSTPIEGAKRAELLAHKTLAPHNKAGEWFSIDFDQAVTFISGIVTTATPSALKSANVSIPEFSVRLSAALSAAGFPEKHHGRADRLAKAFGVSKSAVNYWLNGDKLPSVDKIAALADMCGVSIDWLVTGSEAKAKQSQADTILSTLTEPQRAQALRMLEAFAESCLAVH